MVNQMDTKRSNSRSGRLRESRRRNRRKQGQTQNRRYDSGLREMPPVMTRAGVLVPTEQPKKKRQRNNSVKRRYDIALETPGVEIRLPAVPVVRFSWRFLSLALTFGLFGLLYFMWTAPQFQVQAAEVIGTNRITPLEINSALNLVNRPIFTLNPVELEETLKIAYPELISVAVSVGLPADVFVEVSERVPLLAWYQNDIVHWVDGDGFAFLPRGEVDHLVTIQAYSLPPSPNPVDISQPDFELVTSPRAFMYAEMVNAILGLRAQVPPESQLVYDAQYGIGWADERGWEVYLGTDISDYAVKLDVYNSIVAHLQSEGITPAIINVEHAHAPYFRLER